MRGGIEGTSHPRATSTEASRIAAPALRSIAQCLEAPGELAASCVYAVDLALVRQISAGGSEHQHVARYDGRRGEVAAAALARLGQLQLPDFLSGFRVQRDATPIQRSNVDAPVAERDATTIRSEEHFVCDVIELGVVVPYLAPRRTIKREHAIARADVVDHAVDGEWSYLQSLCDDARLVQPGHVQILHISRCDFPQRTVSRAAEIAMIHRPVLRIVVRPRVASCLRLHVRHRREGDGQRTYESFPKDFHGSFPFLQARTNAEWLFECSSGGRPRRSNVCGQHQRGIGAVEKFYRCEYEFGFTDVFEIVNHELAQPITMVLSISR